MTGRARGRRQNRIAAKSEPREKKAMSRETTAAGATDYIDAKDPTTTDWPGVQPGTTVADGMIFERDVAVTLRDGVRVYVDVRRPDTDVPVPVLIAYGPFGKHRGFPPVLAAGADVEPPLPPGTPFEAPLPQFWVGHGYAVVNVDPRGTWGSEGDAAFFSPQEAADGYDLVEWAGTQPWSNGRIGLSGVSYLAIIQYRIAAARPPHLAAIHPSDGMSDLYREAVQPGGIPETQFAANFETILGFGRQRRENLFAGILAHPFLDEWWLARGVDMARIEVPAYVVCSAGNHGLHTRGTLEAYKAMGSKQKWLEVHGRKEWRHYYTPAEMERQRAFFDHFLKGLDTEIRSWPPVRVEYRDRAETGVVRAEAAWPIPQTRHTALYLDASAAALVAAPPRAVATVRYDPTAVHVAPRRPGISARSSSCASTRRRWWRDTRRSACGSSRRVPPTWTCLSRSTRSTATARSCPIPSSLTSTMARWRSAGSASATASSIRSGRAPSSRSRHRGAPYPCPKANPLRSTSRCGRSRRSSIRASACGSPSPAPTSTAGRTARTSPATTCSSTPRSTCSTPAATTTRACCYPSSPRVRVADPSPVVDVAEERAGVAGGRREAGGVDEAGRAMAVPDSSRRI
jgi:predicted acyl esterase